MLPASVSHVDIRLDDLYRMTAHIYGEQNARRTTESTFCHFAEVCGRLTGLDRNKRRGEINIIDALCESLGWFFSLVAQFRVASIEQVIYRKYPGACPYCRKRPHNDAVCKSALGLTLQVLDHRRLRDL